MLHGLQGRNSAFSKKQRKNSGVPACATCTFDSGFDTKEVGNVPTKSVVMAVYVKIAFFQKD